MIYSQKNRLKAGALSCWMASLFAGGILLGGSEFVGFPWGPVVGALCFVALAITAYFFRNKLP
jgi:hypothetical protein